jgi:glucose/mannose transport system substrate-binding protein
LGLELYKQALVEHQAKALAHPKWIQVFEQMRKLKGFTDPASAGRDWNLATALVMKGQAGFQIMGDWAKGEFTSAKQVPGRDFLCSPTPGSGEVFLATTDSFGFFKGKNSNESGQKLFAEVALDPKVQMEFNLKKGSTPVRLGVASTGYDACGAGNIRDFAQASKKGTLAMGFHSSNPPAIAGAITDLVTQHFNSAMSASEAAQRLAKVIRSAQ